jgi:hypothetical protein
VLANAFSATDARSGLYAAPGAGALVAYNAGFSTTRGGDFAGAAAAGSDENESTNPLFTAFTDNDDPTDDNLEPRTGSPLLDSGPTDTSMDDPDGSQNDRGFTGGPAAP